MTTRPDDSRDDTTDRGDPRTSPRRLPPAALSVPALLVLGVLAFDLALEVTTGDLLRFALLTALLLCVLRGIAAAVLLWLLLNLAAAVWFAILAYRFRQLGIDAIWPDIALCCMALANAGYLAFNRRLWAFVRAPAKPTATPDPPSS